MNILTKATVLVLNSNWQAINVRTPQEAFCMMATNVATGLEIEGEEVSPGVIVAGGSPIGGDTEIEGPAWIGCDVRIEAGVRLMGPVVLGGGASIGDRAQLRECIVFPGTDVADDSILIGAIAGHGGILESMRSPSA